MTHTVQRYRSLASWLKEKFNEPVRKITLDADMSCPNRDGLLSREGCIYCNARGSGTGAYSSGMSISEQVERGISVLSRRYKCKKFIAYFQAFTNTYGTPDRLKSLYLEALRRPEVVGLAVGTRPDCVPEPVLDLLADLGRERLVWVEYGLQSIHDRTLKLLNRGHGSGVFLDAVARSRKRQITVVAHLMIGLPGESIPDMEETARAVVASEVQGVKLHPVYVVQGTALERMYQTGEYRPMTEDEAIDATLAVMEEIPDWMVIHRMTSDPHPDDLVAPLWMLDGKAVKGNLLRALERRDFRQGAANSTKGAARSRRILRSEATPTR